MAGARYVRPASGRYRISCRSSLPPRGRVRVVEWAGRSPERVAGARCVRGVVPCVLGWRVTVGRRDPDRTAAPRSLERVAPRVTVERVRSPERVVLRVTVERPVVVRGRSELRTRVSRVRVTVRARVRVASCVVRRSTPVDELRGVTAVLRVVRTTDRVRRSSRS